MSLLQRRVDGVALLQRSMATWQVYHSLFPHLLELPSVDPQTRLSRQFFALDVDELSPPGLYFLPIPINKVRRELSV